MSEEDVWIIDRAQACHCCPICSQVPCDGVLAGSFCDDLCDCDNEIEFQDEEE